ncbi:protein of unknown function (plasmid) [Azospirillum baldaniorum]|uniref:Uncharacterized protein n=1 Tax=Azospirillum baldaniorum TaxID=1064539 RepID=A0A9P1JXM1_9PROT|nr:protein of unknown function [Azospirillum baldaniorum]
MGISFHRPDVRRTCQSPFSLPRTADESAFDSTTKTPWLRPITRSICRPPRFTLARTTAGMSCAERNSTARARVARSDACSMGAPMNILMEANLGSGMPWGLKVWSDYAPRAGVAPTRDFRLLVRPFHVADEWKLWCARGMVLSSTVTGCSPWGARAASWPAACRVRPRCSGRWRATTR